eukprot:EG_transcript_15463
MTGVLQAAVATYNVLSSSLCSPSSHISPHPEWLNEKNRYEGLLSKLTPVMAGDGTIICLQEVSSLWAGRLHTFFQKRGYYFVFSGYGSRFNGYMGCGIAFPNAAYELESCATPCIADTKALWPKRPQQSWWQKLWAYAVWPFWAPAPPADQLWDIAHRRPNTMVFLRLKAKAEERTLCVGTYHMPCIFQHPQVMVIHAALVAQQMYRLSAGDPFVFAGDFNVKPSDAAYRLLTEGKLPDGDKALPPPLPNDTWRPQLKLPLLSAYREVNGQEPDHTNWSHMKGKSPFVGTLDYLFYGNGLKVKSVSMLPKRPTAQGPYPNAEEPSDHLMLSAVFSS